MALLPSGTVTFLFSDVEGSTQLLERHGAAMSVALAGHHALFEEIVERHGGAIFETVGDAVYAAFSSAGAVSAALDAHRALAAEDWGPIEQRFERLGVLRWRPTEIADHLRATARVRDGSGRREEAVDEQVDRAVTEPAHRLRVERQRVIARHRVSLRLGVECDTRRNAIHSVASRPPAI